MATAVKLPPVKPAKVATAKVDLPRWVVRCQSPLADFVAPDIPGATADDAKREIMRWIERALTVTEH